MLEIFLYVIFPALVFALIVAFVGKLSPTVFLASFMVAMAILIVYGDLDTGYMVIPALILTYLVWNLAKGVMAE